MNQRTIALTLLTLVGAAPSIASGQVAALAERTLVDHSNGGPLTETQLPLPFLIPLPSDNPNASQAFNRKVSVIDGILLDSNGSPAWTSVALGTTQGSRQFSGGQTIAPRPIFAVRVSTAGSTRPDGVEKGRALIVSGLHAREWMAIEGVLRKLETYKTTAFKDQLAGAETGQTPGTLDVYLAQNVQTLFVPVVNGGGLAATQLNPRNCLIATEGTTDEVILKGELRDGRFTRKNLRDNDAVLSSLQDGLDGVDLNRNFSLAAPTNDLKGQDRTFVALMLESPVSETYRGVPTGGAYVAELEVVSLQNGSRDQYLFGDPTVARQFTGAAYLDVHTWADGVFAFGKRDVALPEWQYADAVQLAAYPRSPLKARELEGRENKVTGPSDHFFQVQHRVPAAVLELPGDPDVLRQADDRDLLLTNEVVTLRALNFVVGEGATFSNHAAITSAAVTAALLWAAGPPVLKEVLILQNKTPPGGTADNIFDRSKTGGEAEVLYHHRWEPVPASPIRARTEVDVNHDAGPRWLNGTGLVKVVLVFSKPMRTAVDGPLPDELSFVHVLAPGVTPLDLRPLITTYSWQKATLLDPRTPTLADPPAGVARYEYDTLVLTLDLTGKSATVVPNLATPQPPAALSVAVKDGANLGIDSTPQDVALLNTGIPGGTRGGTFMAYDPANVADRSHGHFFIDTGAPLLVKLTE